MKPVKPNKMSKSEEATFQRWARMKGPVDVTHFRRVLAALEYERQRADEWERAYKSIPPQHRNGPVAMLMREMMAAPSDTYRKAQTAAVVPPKRKGNAVPHARPAAYDVHREKAERPPCGSCQRRERASGLSVCEPCAKDIYGQVRG